MLTFVDNLAANNANIGGHGLAPVANAKIYEHNLAPAIGNTCGHYFSPGAYANNKVHLKSLSL